MDSKTIDEVLVSHFPQVTKEGEPLDQESTLDVLYGLQTQGVDDRSVSRALDGIALEPRYHAVVALLDSVLTKEITSTNLPDQVTTQLIGAVAATMRLAVADGIMATTKGPMVSIVENLIALTIGWTSLNEKAQESIGTKLQEALACLCVATENLDNDATARNHLLQLLMDDLARFVAEERERISKLEQRLIDAEAGQLIAERSRNLAAQLLNSRMQDKVIPQEFVSFLHGAWFDSLQLIATRQGTTSEQWYRAVQLTDTLLSTLQQTSNVNEEESSVFDAAIENLAPDVENDQPKKPVDVEESQGDNQQLYRIIEHLADELKGSLVSIEHDSDALNVELAAIEAVHVSLMKGDAIEGSEFSLLPTTEGMLDENTRVSQSLLAPVRELATGRWFLFSQESGETQHIKLTMKSEEAQHLIFTNRNGANILQTSYEEFAYLLSSGAAQLLPQPGDLKETLRSKLRDTIKQKVKDDEAEAKRLKRLAADKRKKALENTQFVVVAVNKDDLAAGKSPEIDPATLASRDDGTKDRVIFVDSSGLDLGEVDNEEIAKLIAAPDLKVEEVPTDMNSFKASVMKMRTKPVLTNDDDE